MATKPKKTQPRTPEVRQERDYFQTPNYAVDLLVPYLPKYKTVWECAAGDGKIARRLIHHGFSVFSSDIVGDDPINFLTDAPLFGYDIIVTNPAFSIKKLFFDKCIEYGKPFALLVPADRNQWILEAIRKHGAQWLTPTRRIDYLTPNILDRVWKGETSRAIMKHFFLSPKDFSARYKTFEDIPADLVEAHSCHKYDHISAVPLILLARYSASQFHSSWLTIGLNLPYQETIVDLSVREKQTNI